MNAFPASSTLIPTLYDAILQGNARAAEMTVQAALAAGVPVKVLLDEGMTAAMTEIGRRFESGDCFVPEMLIAARAMKAGVAILGPHLVAAGVEPRGVVVIGTVSGDMHDIGKNLVRIMLESSGWRVIDLGVDVSPDRFVQAVQQHQPHILGLSALLTTTLPKMGQTVAALTAAGLRQQVRVMVGGAPVTARFAEQIGADLYAPDAAAAAERVKVL